MYIDFVDFFEKSSKKFVDRNENVVPLQCSQAEKIVHIGRRTKFLPPTRYISDLFLLIFIRPHRGGRGISF